MPGVTLKRQEARELGRSLLERGKVTGPEAVRRRGAIRRRLLAFADASAAVFGFSLAYALSGSLDLGLIGMVIIFSPAWILVAKLHGLYDNDHRRVRHSTVDELSSLLSTAVFGTLVVTALLSFSSAPQPETAEALRAAGFALIASFILRGVVRTVWRSQTRLEVGALIGSGSLAAATARRLALHPEAGLEVIGFLSDSSESSPALDSQGLRWFGFPSELLSVAARHGVERIVIADEHIGSDELRAVVAECQRARLSLTMVPPNPEIMSPGIELNRVAELPMIDFRFGDTPRSTMLIKRCLDLAVSGLLILLLAPLYLAVALAIKLDSKGPVLFRQKRIGKDGKPFTMLKFRSMVSGAEDRLHEVVDLNNLDEPAFKVQNDPRVTRVGRHLRRMSLDELPQLLNVLWGDMSLVGPRPEEEAVVALYDERQRARLSAKPGLTGPMQVYGRGDLSFEERLAIERGYLENPSVLEDLGILMRTPLAVARGDGAY